MKLAFISGGQRGQADRLLSAAARRLQDQGLLLAGVVQTNIECSSGKGCDMDLTVLPDGPLIRISQSLGPGARGCRLDASALEQAVGTVTASLDRQPALLIVNKFGKHEADGRGFRPVIGEALARDIPVLTAVNGANRDAFLAFAGNLAHELPADPDAVLEWANGLAKDAA